MLNIHFQQNDFHYKITLEIFFSLMVVKNPSIFSYTVEYPQMRSIADEYPGGCSTTIRPNILHTYIFNYTNLSESF